MKQLTGETGIAIDAPVAPSPAEASPDETTPAAPLPLVTRFRDPEAPYEDLIVCERDCVRCSYAATLDCDGNCGACPRQSYCPCVNPAKIKARGGRLADLELTILPTLGRN